MEPNIPSNGGERIPKCIVWQWIFPHEHNVKNVSLSNICPLATYALKKTMNCRIRKPNLMCNDEEKMLEVILKYGMLETQKAKHLSLNLHKISAECNDNLNTTLR
jgi:hypothetical protein